MILDRFKVDGRVAVVTGAGRGIGRGISIALAEAGAHVVLAARRENTLMEVAGIVEKNGGKALVCPTDVLDDEQLDRLVSRTQEEFGGVDILVVMDTTLSMADAQQRFSQSMVTLVQSLSGEDIALRLGVITADMGLQYGEDGDLPEEVSVRLEGQEVLVERRDDEREQVRGHRPRRQ